MNKILIILMLGMFLVSFSSSLTLHQFMENNEGQIERYRFDNEYNSYRLFQSRNLQNMGVSITGNHRNATIEICTNLSIDTSIRQIKDETTNELIRIRVKNTTTDETLFHIPATINVNHQKTGNTLRQLDVYFKNGNGNTLPKFENGDNLCYTETIRQKNLKSINYDNKIFINPRLNPELKWEYKNLGIWDNFIQIIRGWKILDETRNEAIQRYYYEGLDL